MSPHTICGTYAIPFRTVLPDIRICLNQKQLSGDVLPHSWASYPVPTRQKGSRTPRFQQSHDPVSRVSIQVDRIIYGGKSHNALYQLDLRLALALAKYQHLTFVHSVQICPMRTRHPATKQPIHLLAISSTLLSQSQTCSRSLMAHHPCLLNTKIADESPCACRSARIFRVFQC